MIYILCYCFLATLSIWHPHQSLTAKCVGRARDRFKLNAVEKIFPLDNPQLGAACRLFSLLPDPGFISQNVRLVQNKRFACASFSLWPT
jgi:hypothetical protein